MLTSTNELIDLNFFDIQLIVNSFHCIDLIFLNGLAVMESVNFDNFSFVLEFEVLSQFFGGILVLNSLLLLLEVDLKFLKLEVLFSFESLKFKFALLSVIISLLGGSLELFIVSGLLLLGVVQFLQFVLLCLVLGLLGGSLELLSVSGLLLFSIVQFVQLILLCVILGLLSGSFELFVVSSLLLLSAVQFFQFSNFHV